ncbi:MAG TPA: YiiD C-terminal domain-containing protein [Salinisphaeraceae bacterium]|nr:YiiD C-terminal domain-containing protein [Salinisphaeraceae bacterium]
MTSDDTARITAAELQRLNQTIASAIPLARAAGIHLQAAGDNTLVARAPFAANSNPHATVFGGSLYVAALVAGYAQTVWLLEAAALEATVVIRHAEADYRRPLQGEIVAHVAPLDATACARFLDAVKRRGRGRIDLTVSVANARMTAFVLHTRFAAIAGEATPVTGPDSCAKTSSAGSSPGSRSTG